MANVTQESDPTLWARLVAQYNEEWRPQFVVRGSVHYQVIQNASTQELEFVPRTTEALYETTSDFPGKDGR